MNLKDRTTEFLRRYNNGEDTQADLAACFIEYAKKDAKETFYLICREVDSEMFPDIFQK